MRSTFSVERQIHGKRRAYVRLALDVNRATMSLHDLPRDEQTKSKPIAAVGRGEARESFEDVAEVLGSDTGPVVPYAKFGSPALHEHGDLHGVLWAIFQRVGYEG